MIPSQAALRRLLQASCGTGNALWSRFVPLGPGSDGLTEMVSDGAIAAVLRVEPDPEVACTKLVALANDAGGRDNVTVLIVRFDLADPERGSGLQ